MDGPVLVIEAENDDGDAGVIGAVRTETGEARWCSPFDVGRPPVVSGSTVRVQREGATEIMDAATGVPLPGRS